MRHASSARVGTSILELVAVLALTAVILAVAVPRMHDIVERAAVRGGVADVVTSLSVARQLAISHGGGVSLGIDAPRATTYVVSRGDTLVTRRLGQSFGVTLRSTRDSLAYDARGLGVGAANLTIIVMRGMTADTVVVSRLGRVRW